MHNDIDLNLKNISKIEGHTHLDAKVRNGKVISCKLKISEGKRFFTNAIIGKRFDLAPSTMSRICGTCSSAHALCSIEAIEKAFGVKPTEQTYHLRNLLMNSGHLRDHAMHLFFFVLPDLLGKDSVLDFSEKHHHWIHDGLAIKEAGNYLATIVGGRAVHPPNVVVGGFLKIPEQKEIELAKEKLKKCRNKILRIIDLLYKNKNSFKRKANYVALINKDYNFLEGQIKTAKGSVIPESKYAEHLERVVLPYSTATAFRWESKDYMVGALARMNLNKESLHQTTKGDVSEYLKIFPSNCIFRNNLAQAIEMLHQVDSSIDILDKGFKKEEPIKINPRESIGVGVVEAPRGTLYYRLDIDKNGIITFADLCIPTQQNSIHLEKDLAKYIQEMLGLSKDKISLKVEEMIRAYDPCMSCATHFLKINWI